MHRRRSRSRQPTRGPQPNQNHAAGRLPLTDLFALLHKALIRGEQSATERLSEALVPLVFARLSVRFPARDPSMRLQATHDAVLWYLLRPEVYKPERSRLDVFLGVVAECRLRDGIRHDMRIRRREMSVDQEVLQRIGDLKVTDHQALNGVHDSRRRLLILIRSRPERVFLDAYLRGASEPRLARILRFTTGSVEADTEIIRRAIKRLHQRAIRIGLRH